MLAEPKSNASLRLVTAFVVMVLISLLGYSYSGLHREKALSSGVDVATSEKAATSDSDAQEAAVSSNEAPLPGSSSEDDSDASEPVSDSSDSGGASESEAAAPGYGQ